MSIRDIILMYAFNVCAVQVFLRWPIRMLATWIAADRRIIDDPLPPRSYLTGGWLSPTEKGQK